MREASILFLPFRVGRFELKHRIVMPPLTRLRAPDPVNAPGAMNAEYYGQRASEGGLQIAEATWTEPRGKPYPNVPGIQDDRQIEGWRQVTDAVHTRGGIIFLQLWHAGRLSHSSTQPRGVRPMAPSAVDLDSMVVDSRGQMVPAEVPIAMDADDIAATMESLALGARNAIAAGFDGVEIHGASGYLIDQFLWAETNRRTDAYGGSLDNRSRFAVELAAAIASAIGADRVGIRLSPFGVAHGSFEADPLPIYTRVIERLAPLKLAYLHLIEPRASGVGAAEVSRPDQPRVAALFRSLWPTALISAGGYDAASATAAIGEGSADAIAFGRFFISNPNLAHRMRYGLPIARYDRTTFYSNGSRGYTDYSAAET